MPSVPRAAPSGPTLFELDDATVRVPGRVLLAPLSATLSAGRVVGLIGHNGSGKSTLVKLLARQARASAGTIRFRGRALDAWGDRPFARQVANLPQQIPAASGLLVRELVAFGRYPWHGPLGRFTAADRQAVTEAMDLIGVAPFADRLVETLSGGERQRAWLAMLVAQGTACLILDEPISALDVAHQVEVLGLVHRLAHQRGMSVVVVLHDVNMAARYCDEILALRAGRLIARGTPAAIMTPDTLAAIYGIPMGVLTSPEGGHPLCYVR